MRELIKKILKEEIYLIESKENYSPAGKEITPNKIVIHKSTPKNRDRILEQGLKVRAGECYKTYAGYGEKCIPAIFATNSVNKRAWFDSSYDDDIWEIDTTMIPDVKWYKDNHYEPTKKHIVTFENIPSEALTLKYEGTESGLMRESKNETKNINAAKEIINSMFDNISFLEVKSKEKIIKVYFETISTAMNEDSWFVNVICDTIKDYTSLKAIPLWWRGSVTDKDVDLYIDTEIVRYDEEGNLINESKEKEPKFLNLIKEIIEPFKEVRGVCDIYVLYNDEDDMYFIDVSIEMYRLYDHFNSTYGVSNHVLNLKRKVRKEIENYLPIPNVYVGSSSTGHCDKNQPT
jgi:hypothetical protein